ncbi:multidrug effflux MFS transporter [Neptunomonas sp.]|uniref:multidrug effflux MFS transporter n=1 Tax=Neptunomonas sp. TaxID=1971898 RepID=UPI0025CE6EC7|nr:multidrug effflux MFS transporter [Neptunomonas sp.]
MSRLNSQSGSGFKEFVVLVALLTSMIALAIDAMLPALPQIGADFNITDSNDTQLVVVMIFVGLSLGQFIYGPLSDNIGRKPSILIGMGLFIVGDLVSLFANDFNTFLLGRFLQGLGVASPKVVSIALIRDLYVGKAMARVMSFMMTIFILVPVLAPGLGQLVLMVSEWRSIFVIFLLLAVVLSIWFSVRMPETLVLEKRRPMTLDYLINSSKEVLTHPTAMGYTLLSGIVFGAFMGYLNLAQPILQQQYQLAEQFPIYFGGLAAAIGLSTLANARLLSRFGMQLLSVIALGSIAILSLLYLPIVHWFNGHPPLVTLICYLLLVFFSVGLLFGNLSALAMEPLGHIAGIGAGVVSSLSTLLGVLPGVIIGQLYNDTLYPMVTGYLILFSLGLLIGLRLYRNSVGKVEPA